MNQVIHLARAVTIPLVGTLVRVSVRSVATGEQIAVRYEHRAHGNSHSAKGFRAEAILPYPAVLHWIDFGIELIHSTTKG